MKFVRAAFARDIAAEAGGGAGKDMVVGLVECKGYQPGAAADGFDHPSGRGGVRLAQIDEHHIALRLSDFCDATRVQVDDANHYNISTVAQGGGQAISNSDEPDLRRSAE